MLIQWISNGRLPPARETIGNGRSGEFSACSVIRSQGGRTLAPRESQRFGPRGSNSLCRPPLCMNWPIRLGPPGSASVTQWVRILPLVQPPLAAAIPERRRGESPIRARHSSTILRSRWLRSRGQGADVARWSGMRLSTASIGIVKAVALGKAGGGEGRGIGLRGALA
jgi:hypothetical protein